MSAVGLAALGAAAYCAFCLGRLSARWGVLGSNFAEAVLILTATFIGLALIVIGARP